MLPVDNPRRRAGRGLLITGAVLLAVGLVLAAGAFWAVRSNFTFATASGAMAPTYPRGERIPVERISGSTVRRGDVVLYRMPGRYGDGAVLQRVIGLGGDHVVFSDGQLTVNGTQLREPYLKAGDAGDPRPYDVKVPAGRMFLLGDNRGNSNDSRYYLTEESGTVPTSTVRGRALDSSTAPMLLGLTAILGVMLAVAGAVCAVVGLVQFRRRAVEPFAMYR
ncbi:signal peptidase I [Streptomyces sp. NBC_01465]|uniref:signal peptidase I n=1 Tax=Streptomyces sp. NBC_01465 TaxID=2903878 RepID=UPI002E35F039|nr:signal peptidase I [Streptomyces sp. NBC_01465]